MSGRTITPNQADLYHPDAGSACLGKCSHPNQQQRTKLVRLNRVQATPPCAQHKCRTWGNSMSYATSHSDENDGAMFIQFLGSVLPM